MLKECNHPKFSWKYYAEYFNKEESKKNNRCPTCREIVKGAVVDSVEVMLDDIGETLEMTVRDDCEPKRW